VLVPETFLGAIGVGVAVLVLLAVIGAIGVARAKPMKVMRDVA
jgi:ABC-type antimicrobial peptide transport system permease subunit